MLKVENLGKSFAVPGGAVNVIDGVSFEIPEGRCYALLGPSGCGKTTTLRCVAGLERPDMGTISIGGRMVSDPANGVFVPVHERAIGMVFQSYAIWPHLDVFENVAYPLRIHRPRLSTREIDERVSDALALVGIQSMAKRSATLLSGGQQQRVALARAVVRRPALLLLDEPLSNLDARMRDQMRNELHEMINKVGLTALYVTHDQAEAFALAHRIAVMEGGRIIQEGAPRAIYQRPETPFVAKFLGSANILTARLQERRADTAVFALEGKGSPCLHLSLPEGSETGEQFEIIIRPEHTEVHFVSPSDWQNVMRGTIRWLTFLGDQCECGIDIGGTLMRSVVEPSRDIAAGTAVWLRIDPERCIAFRKKD